jgi:uncharacterized membrane-anchored protein YhcB (DUF1043 family)
VYSSHELWLAVLLALAAGIAIGVVLSRYLRRGTETRQDPIQQLRELQEEQKNYRYSVTEHFSRTAELLTQLAGNYREVHNHLARGAQDLCDPSAVKMLKTLPEDSPVLEEQRPVTIEPPRDYAPRGGAYDGGTLDEDFGLEKPARPAAPQQPPYL